MTKTLTNEKAVMQGLWRKALDFPKGLTIPCGSQPAAARLRFALYNGVRAFRKGEALPDEKLVQALAELTISFTPDKSGLIIGQKAATGMMPQLLTILGEVPATAEELLQEKEEQEAAKRFLEMMQKDQTKPAEMLSQGGLYGARS